MFVELNLQKDWFVYKWLGSAMTAYCPPWQIQTKKQTLSALTAILIVHLHTLGTLSEPSTYPLLGHFFPILNLKHNYFQPIAKQLF